MNLLIQREDAYDFLDCWRQAIHRRSYRSRVRPYDETKGALVFSFDIEMKPFLGDHWGWNRPEARTYFYQTPTLIETIAQIMLIFPDRDAGGRVFINNKQAYYRDNLSSQERELCELTWPEDIDIVSEVRNSWLELPRRSVLTLQNVRYRSRAGAVELK